jgi:hypothetical protein
MSNRRRSQGHRSESNTAVMCRFLDVSRSGFYEWLSNPLSDRALEDQRLLGLIRAAYTASHGVYGAPRIFLDLREAVLQFGQIIVGSYIGPGKAAVSIGSITTLKGQRNQPYRGG